MVVISPSPIPASVFYSQSLPGKGSLLCTVADGVELHTHRQSVPGNPKKTEKAASLLEGVTSAHLHILTGGQVLLMWRKQTKGTFFLVPGWAPYGTALGEKVGKILYLAGF